MTQTAKRGHPRRPWPEEKVQRLRYLVSRGLTMTDICYALEDEFGLPCSTETLRTRLRLHDIQTPGPTWKPPTPWSEAKIQRLTALVAEGLTCRQIATKFRAEFGTTHGKDVIKTKIRQLGLRQKVAEPEPVEPAEPPVRELSILKVPDMPCRPLKVLYRQCQFPIGEPRRRDFRLCGDPVPPGRPYCDEHRKLCWIRQPEGRERVPHACG